MVFREVGARLRREYGSLISTFEESGNPVLEHFLSCDESQALDFLEACFQTRSHCGGNEVVDEINVVLREEATGFELTQFPLPKKRTSTPRPGEVFASAIGAVDSSEQEFPRAIRVDSQALHQLAVQPAFSLLSDPRFRGADAEFRRAHEHFRHGRFAESLNESLKAFESAMKIICGLKGWRCKQTDTAKTLVKTCLDNGLLPTFSQEQLNGLRLLLESAVPTTRNKLSGHGQGTHQVTVPEHIASFALHATAANILLMVGAAGK